MLAAAIAAVVLLAAPPAGAKPLKMIWGPLTLPSGASAFPVYRELGVDVLQMQISWREIATARPQRPGDPSDPAYRWPALVDAAVAEAPRHGIRVALMVKETPPWANGGGGPARAPLMDSDYGDFLMAASRRYATVRHWMVWGEPQRHDAFDPMPPNSPVGPRRYARLLDRAYVSLKSVRRSNIVIGGNTWTHGPVTPRDFVRWMRLPNGRPPRLDYFGHNPFSARPPKLSRRPYHRGLRDMSDVDTFAREIRRAYRRTGRRPRLWLSEYTVSSDRTNPAFHFYVSRREQARWLRAAFRIAQRYRPIAAIGWYNLLDQPGPHGLTTGLLDAEARPKPAFYAFRRAL